MAQVAEYEVLPERFHDEAFKRLKQRIRAGEKAADILRVYDEYYCNKIVEGTMPLSYTMYNRIMKCDEEDAKLLIPPGPKAKK